MNKSYNTHIATTLDGSHTLYNVRFGEHYHSTFGAIQESEHIFIRSGLEAFAGNKKTINVFEMGFGTGLNALLTYLFCEKTGQRIHYYGLEAFPVDMDTARKLNYPLLLYTEPDVFLKLHLPEKQTALSSGFFLEKEINTLEKTVLPDARFDVVYYDAFSPETQAELWTPEVFGKIYHSMKSGAVLTTYSCKGSVKRALKTAGFKLEKLPGPPGKREFLRAMK